MDWTRKHSLFNSYLFLFFWQHVMWLHKMRCHKKVTVTQMLFIRTHTYQKVAPNSFVCCSLFPGIVEKMAQQFGGQTPLKKGTFCELKLLANSCNCCLFSLSRTLFIIFSFNCLINSPKAKSAKLIIIYIWKAESSKSSHLRSWNKWIFVIFAS